MPDSPVLLVDDDPEILSLFSELLEMHGEQAITAGNGEQALRLILDRWRARQPPFSAVVSDWKMPVMDGLELLARIRSGEFHALPFVLVSGAVTADVLLAAVQYGPDAVLLKPFNIDALCVKIQEARDIRERKERERARTGFTRA
jgi:CheY-like chemotaxis protein